MAAARRSRTSTDGLIESSSGIQLDQMKTPPEAQRRGFQFQPVRGGAPVPAIDRDQSITVTVSAMFFEAFFSQEIFTFSPAFSFACE